MHDDYLLSNWMMEDGRGKEERKAKVDNNEEEKFEKLKKGKRRKKRTKRRESKEEGTVCFLWRHLKS